MAPLRKIGDRPVDLWVVDDDDSSSPFDATPTKNLGPEAVQKLKGILKDKKRNARPSLQQIIEAVDSAFDPFDPAQKLPENYKKAYYNTRKKLTQDLIVRAEHKKLK